MLDTSMYIAELNFVYDKSQQPKQKELRQDIYFWEFQTESLTTNLGTKFITTTKRNDWLRPSNYIFTHDPTSFMISATSYRRKKTPTHS